jgi:hypothetical protein
MIPYLITIEKLEIPLSSSADPGYGAILASVKDRSGDRMSGVYRGRDTGEDKSQCREDPEAVFGVIRHRRCRPEFGDVNMNKL